MILMVRLGCTIGNRTVTAFNKDTDLPATINTVERLYVWASEVLARLYPNETVAETQTKTVRKVEGNVYPVDDGSSLTYNYISRASLPVAIAYKEGQDGLWAYVGDIGVSAIPANMKS